MKEVPFSARPTAARQTTAHAKFPPADVPERNDILLENRVAISGSRLANAVQHGTLPGRIRGRCLLLTTRVCLRFPGRAGTPRIGWPGKVYRVEIDLVGTSVAFRTGHRIRVHVTSSHFPQFDRNPNTGAKFGTTTDVRVAEQTVFHDADRPSHILLPVIPPRRP